MPRAHLWIEAALAGGRLQREPHWSEALAVGSPPFVEGVQAALGARARSRHVDDAPGVSVLRESEAPYEAHSGAEMVRLTAPDGRDCNESSAQRGGCGGETALGALRRNQQSAARDTPTAQRFQFNASLQPRRVFVRRRLEGSCSARRRRFATSRQMSS